MRVKDRYERAAAPAPCYPKGGYRERGEFLDAFCLAAGSHCKYAMAVLRRRRRVGVRRPVVQARRYGLEFRHALLLAWAVPGYVCSQGLQPFRPELISLLDLHQHLHFDAPAQQTWLDAVYTEDPRLSANGFQPVMKLAGKQSVGQRTRRLYDTPKAPCAAPLTTTPPISSSIASGPSSSSTTPPAR